MILAWLKNAFRSRYARLLEDELARERGETQRLRAENRALLNSLLSTAGCPPVDFDAGKSEWREIPRLRRRSWHQIAARHEVEQTRRAQLQEQARRPDAPA